MAPLVGEHDFAAADINIPADVHTKFDLTSGTSASLPLYTWSPVWTHLASHQLNELTQPAGLHDSRCLQLGSTPGGPQAVLDGDYASWCYANTAWPAGDHRSASSRQGVFAFASMPWQL